MNGWMDWRWGARHTSDQIRPKANTLVVARLTDTLKSFVFKTTVKNSDNELDQLNVGTLLAEEIVCPQIHMSTHPHGPSNTPPSTITPTTKTRSCVHED